MAQLPEQVYLDLSTYLTTAEDKKTLNDLFESLTKAGADQKRMIELMEIRHSMGIESQYKNS
jgi:hypothetical protein